MKNFFTCVDVTGYDDMHDFYEPTVYSVLWVIPQDHISEDRVIWEASLHQLNLTPIGAIHFLQRTKRRVFTTLEETQSDEAPNILSLLQTAKLSDRTTASKVQGLWFRPDAWRFDDLRKMVRSGTQFPPYGEYFSSMDALCHQLEMQYRKMDTGDLSEKFWPHQWFLPNGKMHPDFPGYLEKVPHFPELPM